MLLDGGGFFVAVAAAPRANPKNLPDGFAFAFAGSRNFGSMAFPCTQCFTYGGVEKRGDGCWRCDRCEDRRLAAVLKRDRAVRGAQPAVCVECREPFMASRRAVKFCSSSCRARQWRGVRLAAV
jgi:hypothetical protein